MKVDAKIVPVTEKTGWFATKEVQQLQYCIQLEEDEKVVINVAELRNFIILPRDTDDGIDLPIYPWVDRTEVYVARYNCTSIRHAQSRLKELKTNLTKLRDEMKEFAAAYEEETSFEL